MKIGFKTEMLLAMALAAEVAICCAPKATNQELQQMCEQLSVLRKEKPGESNLQKCIAEAEKEGVSQRQARCRIAAINLQEYWNRCRRGEARKK